MSRARTLVLVLFAVTPLLSQTPNVPLPTPVAPTQVQAPPPVALRPGSDSVNIVITKYYPAVYSQAAEDKKLQGRVVLSILFDETGTKEKVEVVSGDPILAECATAATDKWKIAPFIRNGKAVKVKTPYTFEFVYDTASASFKSGPANTADSMPNSVQRIILGEAAKRSQHIIKKVQPSYPQEAKNLSIQGQAKLIAVIGKDGAVHELYPLSGPPVLLRAAWDAVRQWKYKPYEFDGKAVEVEVPITVNFTLSAF